MIDEAGDVAADGGVAAPGAIDPEHPDASLCEVSLLARPAVAIAHQLAGVVDDARVLGDRLGGEHAVAVQLRPAADDLREWLWRAGHRWALSADYGPQASGRAWAHCVFARPEGRAYNIVAFCVRRRARSAAHQPRPPQPERRIPGPRSVVPTLPSRHQRPGERSDDRGRHIGHRRRPAEQPLQRRHALVGDAARHDQVEIVEIGGHVEREAVARDPARDADADRRELLVADPDAGQPGIAAGADRRTRATARISTPRGRARSGARRSDRA